MHGAKVSVSEVEKSLKENQDPTRDAQREANLKKREAQTLPLDREVNYKTRENMSDDEKKKEDEELARERAEAQKIKNDAETKGLSPDEIPEGSLNEIKLFKEYYLGKMAQLDFNIKTGKYSLNEEINTNAYELGRKVRDSVMNTPERVSSIIATMDDEVQIRELLVEELIYALEGVMS